MRPQRLLLLAGAVALLIGIWSRPDGRLHVLFPPIPGDAAFALTPGGALLAIDGGSDPLQTSQALGRLLPPWHREIRLLVLTSADPLRLPGAIGLARRYTIRQALLPRTPSTNDERTLVRLLREQGTQIAIARSGQRIALDSVTLEIAAEDETMQLLLHYGRSSLALLPSSGTLAPAAHGWRAQALWYPWAGPEDRTLAEQVGARYVIYSEGGGEHDPSWRTYAERGAAQRTLLHERLDGSIELVGDGRRLWLEGR